MSRINELIQKMDINQVSNKTIKELCISLKKGTLKTTDLLESGYPVINSGRGLYGYYNEYNNEANAFTIAARGEYAGYINYFNEKFWAGGLCYPYRSKDEEKVLTKYIYYCLKKKEQEIRNTIVADGSIPALNKTDLEKITIPVIPVEIQREIVIILDKFGELESKLDEELKERKSQLEFWRKRIILKNKKMMKIKDICITMVGGDVPKNNFSAEKTEEFSIPIYSNSIDLDGLYGYTNIIKVDKKCVTLSGRGAGVGHAFLRTNPFFPIIRLVCLIPKEEFISAEYLYHAIQLVKFKIPATGIPQLTVPMVSDYEIPVPSLEEQKKIVEILGRFDKLINDTTIGIPAEIELRRKQYEYYRNKLLSFEELSVSE